MHHSENEQQKPQQQAAEDAAVEPTAEQNGKTDEPADLSVALAAARAEAQAQQELALRTQAEMENVQKRLQRELDKSRRYALERIMNDLLPVVDSLERGLITEEGQASSDQIREGAELTLKMLHKVVADHGLVVVDPLYHEFDPESHQAMTMQTTTEHEPNTVVAVMQKGYRLNDRLIRPALVMVAQAPE